MFSKALELATKFTFPVIFTRRFRRGQISSSLGTFVVVNPDGWILTADHIVADILKFSDSQLAIADHEQQKLDIEANPGLKDHEKRRKIQKLPVSDEWITHQATLWGDPAWTVSQFFRDPLADVAIAKINGFNPAVVGGYPVFRNPSEDFKVGTSLCRLGHPFHDIKASFDSASGQFSLDPGTLPVPRFPNDGILTRFVAKNAADSSRQVLFIETSSAGLRGQSGGPIFDSEGRIYAVQSQTISLTLSFAPSVKQGSREIVEHQFMHLGWGTHVRHCMDILRAHGATFLMDPP